MNSHFLPYNWRLTVCNTDSRALIIPWLCIVSALFFSAAPNFPQCFTEFWADCGPSMKCLAKCVQFPAFCAKVLRDHSGQSRMLSSQTPAPKGSGYWLWEAGEEVMVALKIWSLWVFLKRLRAQKHLTPNTLVHQLFLHTFQFRKQKLFFQTLNSM